MRTPAVCLLFLIASFIVSGRVNGHERNELVQFPKPGKGWKALEYEQKIKSCIPWHWAVFSNSENGDLLSFAAHRVGQKESRRLIFWSDTAREIFPIGHPVWINTSKQRTTGTSNTIRNGVVELKA